MVATATEQELVAALGLAQHNVSLTTVKYSELLIVGGIPLIDSIDTTKIQVQTINLIAIDPRTPKGLWHQA
ncbi:hypothetical protein D3C85_1422410 [compost metagenome]